MPSGLTNQTATTIAVGPAVLYKGATRVGVSRGGVRVERLTIFRNVPFDGKVADIAGLDRIVYHGLRVTGTFLELPDAMIRDLEHQVASNLVGSVKVYSPLDGQVFLADANYTADLRVVVERPNGSLIRFSIPRAIPIYTIGGGGGADDEAGIDLQFMSRNPAASDATLHDAPYTIEDVSAGGDPNLPPGAQDALVLATPLDLGDGAQAIAMLVGPAGQLGSTSGVDTNDPGYVAGPPAHLTTDGADYVTHGNVLDPVIIGAPGWSIMSALDLSAGDLAGTFPAIVSRRASFPAQIQLYIGNTDRLTLSIANTAGGTDSWEANVGLTTGKHVVGVTFDPAASRASRAVLYIDGAAVAATHTPAGSDGTIATSSGPLHFGMPADSSLPSLSKYGAYYFWNRPLTLSEWQANRSWIVTSAPWS